MGKSTCGSLITYRQYNHVIASAPQCFRKGCGPDRLDSMSSGCERYAPCYTLYNMIYREYQQDWCEGCPGDTACRISGWPILNATATCDTSPNEWIFGPDGSCCGGRGEPDQVSKWISNICNGTYKAQFQKYNGMEAKDWEEWKMPWNWTVEARNTSTSTVGIQSCPKSSRYLGMFAAENIVFLLIALLFPFLRLLYIRAKQNEGGNARRFSARVARITRLFRRFRWGTGENRRSVATVVFAIVFALFLTSAQVGANFGSAFLIKHHPGYQDVPAPLLALLFCSRPHLTWLACSWALLGHKDWLERVFGLHEPSASLEGRLVVSSVAIGSALSEVLIQILGSYSMGKAVHVGVVRKFYLAHRIRPYVGGKDARLMYVGALLWLVASAATVVSWILAMVLGVFITQYYGDAKSYFKYLFSPNTPEARAVPWRSRVLGSRHSARQSQIQYNEKPIDAPLFLDTEQVLRPSGDNRSDSNPLSYVMRRGAGNSSHDAQSSSMNVHSQVMRPPETSNGTYSRSRLGPYAAVPSDDMEVTVMRPRDMHRPTTSGTTPSINHAGSSIEEDHIMAAPPGTSSHRYQTRDASQGSNVAGFTAADEDEHLILAPTASHTPPAKRPLRFGAYEAVPNTAYDGGRGDDVDSRSRESEKSSREQQRHVSPPTFQSLQTKFVISGIILGLFSFVAQWLFWSGFVKAAGERFCPPDVVSTGAIFSVGSLIGMGFSFNW